QTLMLVMAIGFPLAIIFAWAFEMTPEGIKKEKNVDRTQSVTHETGRKLDRMIIGIMAVVIAFLVLDRFVLTDAPIEGTQVADTTPLAIEDEKPAAETGPSVAVLPFVNMSDDASNEYFSDGLTETLLHMLAQLPDLRVAARTSSFAFKGKNTSISDIASTLGVAHILEGSVQKSGERIRVTAQLIRANDGFHVWSQNYTRPLEDIFAIQDEIATDVARALDASLLGGNIKIQNVETKSLSAYEAYLKALEQQAINTYASLPMAQSLFKEAIAADPQFVDAKIGLARNYTIMAWVGIIDEDDAQELAIPILRQVLDANPDHYQARALLLHTGLGIGNSFEPQEREQKYQELRDLLPLFPNNSFLRYIVAGHLSFSLTNYQEAIEVLQAGLLVDPLDPLLHARLGQTYKFMDRYNEAMDSLQRALALEPDDANHYFNIADLKEELGDLNGALEWQRKAIEVDPRDHEMAAEMAQNLYQLGLLEEGNRWASKSIALAPTSAVGRKVAMQQAYYQQDYEQALFLAQNMINDEVSVRHGSHSTALAIYTELMWKSDRQQEAFDYLVSRRPELADFSSFPGNYTGLQTQRFLVVLMTAFKSPEEVRQAWHAYANNMDKAFLRWREFTGNQVLDLVMQGRSDEAERLAVDVYLSEPIATNIRRIEYLREPVFGAINQRPEMLAKLSEVEQERDKLRDGVSEMLLEPEWNQ
ncbi:MAG: tetratricopeptide repeat protein, partial [Xanthomonadales bacterium]|nr:tetratricopeptide repeat protein [Xanthomonadales bacterium]